ncbi:hypothetical protein OL548_22480 [Lysinibacillus sp. MHQ-1]|nr:hypothetical protein OL548_22480 [Lysinibacillus sp. MHQ-1]
MNFNDILRGVPVDLAQPVEITMNLGLLILFICIILMLFTIKTFFLNRENQKGIGEVLISMWSYFKFEFKQFFLRIRKNLAIYFFACFLQPFFYVFKLAPAYDPIEQVEYEEIEARYLTRQEFLNSMEGRNLYSLHPAIIYAVEIFGQINPLDKARLEALEEGGPKKNMPR